jgi:hypothetical protein
MSSGLIVDQSCASLPIPNLFPKVGKPATIIHKLDSSAANSPNKHRWDCFWCMGFSHDILGGIGVYPNQMRASFSMADAMKVDIYC